MVEKIKTIDELNGLEITDGGIIPFAFNEGEIHFLLGREAKDIKSEDRALWSDFGGKIRKNKENNFEGLTREFWEESNGLLCSMEGIRKYIMDNFEKLLIVHSKDYNGVIVFIPIEYDKKLENIFKTNTVFYKHLLDTKKEIQKARKRGLLEKDMIQWHTLAEISKTKKKFRKRILEIMDYILIAFS